MGKDYKETFEEETIRLRNEEREAKLSKDIKYQFGTETSRNRKLDDLRDSHIN